MKFKHFLALFIVLEHGFAPGKSGPRRRTAPFQFLRLDIPFQEKVTDSGGSPLSGVQIVARTGAHALRRSWLYSSRRQHPGDGYAVWSYAKRYDPAQIQPGHTR